MNYKFNFEEVDWRRDGGEVVCPDLRYLAELALYPTLQRMI
jgi:hypothetical protein